jgi:uncharacterized protein YdeI (YjbR/CyaY-like superfamily)
MTTDTTISKRPKQTMPMFVKKALNERDLMAAYNERPPYQQNDYLYWIKQAKFQDTKDRRLAQMLVELEQGGLYMHLKHEASRKA